MNKKVQFFQLPKITDPRGNITFLENEKHIPFEIRRVFYLYDVPGGESRAGHALKTCQQFIIAVSGSFDVVLNDSFSEKTYSLNRSYYGLFLPPMIWRVLNNFSSGSICLVLASDVYDENDYIRDYDSYRAAVEDRNTRKL